MIKQELFYQDDFVLLETKQIGFNQSQFNVIQDWADLMGYQIKDLKGLMIEIRNGLKYAFLTKSKGRIVMNLRGNLVDVTENILMSLQIRNLFPNISMFNIKAMGAIPILELCDEDYRKFMENKEELVCS